MAMIKMESALSVPDTVSRRVRQVFFADIALAILLNPNVIQLIQAYPMLSFVVLSFACRESPFLASLSFPLKRLVVFVELASGLALCVITLSANPAICNFLLRPTTMPDCLCHGVLVLEARTRPSIPDLGGR